MSSKDEAAVRSAVVDIIRQFKPDGVSDLDAAINVISHHAETIRHLQDRCTFLEGLIRSAADAAFTREGL